MLVLQTEAELAAAVAALTAIEPRFRAVVEAHGLPPMRRMAPGLEGLLRIITDQLISLTAGEAIWSRLRTELAPFDAERLSRMREPSLMRLGLSAAKARSFRALACEVCEGRLDFEALHDAPDSEALARLTAISGIGPWTAHIYLLAAMGRADAWPGGDVALQVAAQHLFELEKRPDSRCLAGLAEPWRPWRAVAARLLWSHYRGLKGLPQKIG